MTQALRDNILVISHKVLRPDMNSGDLRLFSMIEILAKDNEIIFVSTGCRPGDDVYVSLLERFGVKVYVETFSLWKLLKTSIFRAIILEFYFLAEYYLDRIRILQPGSYVVVDSVDVHYLRFKLKYDLTKDVADYNIYLQTKERELDVYRKADAVITVTEDDATALIGDSIDIICEVVPNIHNVVLTDKLPEKNTLIFIGGFSHEPNVDAVLYFCCDILPLIKKKCPDIHFTIVGSNPPEEIRQLENDTIKVTGYVPETTPYLHRSHISVAPLRFGAGMKGKIGEAMAHGVPVVTTSVGAQGMGLTDRLNVMIADTPKCFADAVLALLSDCQLCEMIRNNAVKIIEDNYTSKQVGQRMISTLQRIYKRPVKILKFNEKVTFVNSYISQWIKSRFSGC